MTPAPYTPEAVAALRSAAARNIPAEEIAQQLGWDAARVARVCATHRIDLLGLHARPATGMAVARTVPRRNPHADDLGGFCDALPAKTAQLLRALLRHPLGTRVTEHETGLTSATISAARGRINLRLARDGLPYRIEARQGSNQGYWLERVA